MSTETVERLYEEIMELDECDREQLSDRIEQSFDDQGESEALRDEFNRRSEGHRLGHRKSIPWDGARAVLRGERQTSAQHLL